MPTLLVTSRMSPALAARVLAAVRGERAHANSRQRPLTALLRLTTFGLVIAAVSLFVYYRNQSASELSQARATLLDSMQSEGRTLTRADKELAGRVEAAIALHASLAYAGDQLSELRDPAQLTEALAQPTLYLRGSLDALSRPGRVAEVAASSGKDAFVLCLLAPPESRTEKALRVKASAASANGASMQVAGHIEPVDPLLRALPLLGSAWRERVVAAETSANIALLQRLFEAAPVKAAVRAAKARQLLLVIDETSDSKGPTELDGERPHSVRVVLTDLTSGELRLRYRHTVDPGWLSDNARALYASGIDSCALALDLRAALAQH